MSSTVKNNTALPAKTLFIHDQTSNEHILLVIDKEWNGPLKLCRRQLHQQKLSNGWSPPTATDRNRLPSVVDLRKLSTCRSIIPSIGSSYKSDKNYSDLRSSSEHETTSTSGEEFSQAPKNLPNLTMERMTSELDASTSLAPARKREPNPIKNESQECREISQQDKISRTLKNSASGSRPSRPEENARPPRYKPTKRSENSKLKILQLEFHEPVKYVREHCHQPKVDAFYLKQFLPYETVNLRSPSTRTETPSRGDSLGRSSTTTTNTAPLNGRKIQSPLSSLNSEIVFNKQENSVTGSNLRYELTKPLRQLDQTHEAKFNEFIRANLPSPLNDDETSGRSRPRNVVDHSPAQYVGFHVPAGAFRCDVRESVRPSRSVIHGTGRNHVIFANKHITNNCKTPPCSYEYQFKPEVTTMGNRLSLRLDITSRINSTNPQE